MKLNLLIIALLVLTLGIQVSQLYRGHSSERVISRDVNSIAIPVNNLPSKGSTKAAVALIEFSDYECPFCARYVTGAAKQVEEQYVKAGTVQYYFSNNPLPIHAQARFLATAAICAGTQQRFWDMHDLLFVREARTPDSVNEIASELTLDEQRFGACLAGDFDREISDQQAVAKGLGLEVTPAFAIGVKGVPGRVLVKKVIFGAQPFKVFEQALASVLAEVK